MGQGALALSLFALTSALIEAGRSGWLAPHIIAAFATTVLLVVLFVAMMGTLVQMQHGRGMLISFALVFGGFLVMAAVSARAIAVTSTPATRPG